MGEWLWDDDLEEFVEWNESDDLTERWLRGEDVSEDYEDDGSITLTKEEADELE